MNNKTLFTSNEVMTLIETLGSKLHVSINRAGNIKVVNPIEQPKCSANPFRRSLNKLNCGFWVLYKFADGKFLWRHHDGTGYCYPLNMRGRKFEGKVTKQRNDETGRIEYWGYKPYNIEMSMFNTFDEAVEYFINYLKKYRGIIL